MQFCYAYYHPVHIMSKTVCDTIILEKPFLFIAFFLQMKWMIIRTTLTNYRILNQLSIKKIEEKKINIWLDILILTFICYIVFILVGPYKGRKVVE